MITENKPLKNLNTFGFDAVARYYAAPESVTELKKVLGEYKKMNLPLFILGGGSNVLFSNNFEGLVIHPQIQGIELIEEDPEYIWVKVGAGVVWDSFVEYVVNKNWGGVENLSLIPGNVGASPVQNVGAYGMEAKDTIESVDGIYIDNLTSFKFSNKECKFGYRNSVFKNELKQKTIVTYVTFRLNKYPKFKLEYGNIKDELTNHSEINLENIRKAVINIRESKLPDPKFLGNAGSFFKNPVVEESVAQKLLEEYPLMPTYASNNGVKIPAGWLIEKSGLKGYRMGDVGVHEKQALVLVNYGRGYAEEILRLSDYIKETVFNKFNIRIEPEVIII